MFCYCVGVVCTSDAFHSKIRNDSSDQECVCVFVVCIYIYIYTLNIYICMCASILNMQYNYILIWWRAESMMVMNLLALFSTAMFCDPNIKSHPNHFGHGLIIQFNVVHWSWVSWWIGSWIRILEFKAFLMKGSIRRISNHQGIIGWNKIRSKWCRWYSGNQHRVGSLFYRIRFI